MQQLNDNYSRAGFRLPGYTGHQRGVRAENRHGRSIAWLTANDTDLEHEEPLATSYDVYFHPRANAAARGAPTAQRTSAAGRNIPQSPALPAGASPNKRQRPLVVPSEGGGKQLHPAQGAMAASQGHVVVDRSDSALAFAGNTDEVFFNKQLAKSHPRADDDIWQQEEEQGLHRSPNKGNSGRHAAVPVLNLGNITSERDSKPSQSAEDEIEPEPHMVQGDHGILADSMRSPSAKAAQKHMRSLLNPESKGASVADLCASSRSNAYVSLGSGQLDKMLSSRAGANTHRTTTTVNSQSSVASLRRPQARDKTPAAVANNLFGDSAQGGHIPGFQGFVPHVQSEAMCGMRFAESTTKAYNWDEKARKEATVNTHHALRGTMSARGERPLPGYMGAPPGQQSSGGAAGSNFVNAWREGVQYMRHVGALKENELATGNAANGGRAAATPVSATSGTEAAGVLLETADGPQLIDPMTGGPAKPLRWREMETERMRTDVRPPNVKLPWGWLADDSSRGGHDLSTTVTHANHQTIHRPELGSNGRPAPRPPPKPASYDRNAHTRKTDAYLQRAVRMPAGKVDPKTGLIMSLPRCNGKSRAWIGDLTHEWDVGEPYLTTYSAATGGTSRPTSSKPTGIRPVGIGALAQ